MPNVNRVKRSLFRSGELQECLTPTCSQGSEVPAVEVVGAVDGTQDGFESGNEGVDGANAAGKNRPLELNPAGRQLTSADFQQQQVQEAQGVQGANSARAQQVNQAESPYSEPAPYEAAAEAVSNDRALEVSGFQEAEDVPENARVDQAAQAHAAEMESRRFAELAEQPFSLVGRTELRA